MAAGAGREDGIGAKIMGNLLSPLTGFSLSGGGGTEAAAAAEGGQAEAIPGRGEAEGEPAGQDEKEAAAAEVL